MAEEIRWTAFLAVILGLALAGPAARAGMPYEVITFQTSYSAYDNGRDGPWTFPVKVWTPTQAGTYPLAIVVGGAGQCPNPLSCPTSFGSWAETVARDAAAHGIIAAAVHYDSAKPHFCGCTGAEAWSGTTPEGETVDCASPKDGWDDKARAIFDNGNYRSTLRRVLRATGGRAAKASLAEGLVVFGHSQGSFIAHLAQAYTTRGTDGVGVTAAMLTGTGIRGYGASTPKPYTVDCNLPGPAAVPSAVLRAFNGEHDHLLSVNTKAIDPPLYAQGYVFPLPSSAASAFGARRSLNKVTGACPVTSTGPNVCYPFAGQGSGGWRVVMDEETGGGLAEHQFFYSTGTKIDPLWRNGGSTIDGKSPPISLRANLNWMAQRLGAPAVQY